MLGALDLAATGYDIDPGSLRASLFGLTTAGQQSAARRLAIQTLLSGQAS